MSLSSELISQFVKTTNDKKERKTESTVYGTTVEHNGKMYVRLDGSELLTPVSTTADTINGERVSVTIKNHMATVTGNFSSPAARVDDVTTANNKINAAEGNIKDLQSENVVIKEKLIANETVVNELEANVVTVNQKIEAAEGEIDTLKTTKLDVEKADARYANIDFSNIGKAAMEYFYANSGLIQNVVVGDSTITGQLVGVTINGDRIEGNTIIADKLVIKGNDGLYYKLNTDGVTVEKDQTEYNSLNGSVILAKSITATKIRVDDLVAFDATIGGFHITSNSIYSGVKDSIDNTTSGLYMDNDGQIFIGDSNNYIRYYKDQNGEYHLETSLSSMVMTTSGETIATSINNVKEDADNLKNALSTTLDTSLYFTESNIKLYSKKPDGVTVEALNLCDSSGNTVLGYGNYDAGSGNTNIYGNDVYIGPKTGGSTYRPYYRPGDSISIDIYTAGFVTNANKEIWFTVPLCKPVVGVLTVTPSSVNGFILREGNSYTHGSGASTYAKPSSYVGYLHATNEGVKIKATFTTTTNSVNNSPIGVRWSGKITFS